MVTDEKAQVVISYVQQKKELQFLSDSFIQSHFIEICRLEKKLREKITQQSVSEFSQSKELKLIGKAIRQKARKIYGIFQDVETIQNRSQISTTSVDDEHIRTLLKTHISTQERLPYYEEFFKKIFSLTKKPKSILDLACGLNPVAYYAFTRELKTSYTACELSEKDVAHLQDFFQYNNVPAKALVCNIVKNTQNIPQTPVEICFLLKTLDTCEYQQKYITYDILDAIHASYIVASFPIQNIKGKQMNRTKRISWFEKICTRKDYSFHICEFPGEIVYILTK
ncbi:MAG: hypothetical protein ACMXYA_03540 [Candidatus Woesearchaeota archaeon]